MDAVDAVLGGKASAGFPRAESGPLTNTGSRGSGGGNGDPKLHDRRTRIEACCAWGVRWQKGSVVDADDVEGVRILSHAQAHPNVDVGLHLSGDDAERPLSREDEMHSQRPSQGCQVLQQICRLRVGRHEGVELINDDDQPRRRIVEFEDIGTPVVGQEPLAAGDLSTDGDQCAEGSRGIEVVEDAVGMRQLLQRGESRTALEIDENEHQPRRWVFQSHCQQPGLKQNRLPAACRSSHERVRSVVEEVESDVPISSAPNPHGTRCSVRPALTNDLRCIVVEIAEAMIRQPFDVAVRRLPVPESEEPPRWHEGGNEGSARRWTICSRGIVGACLCQAAQ